MGNCTICGGIALTGKTCVMCSMGRFPDETPKEIAKARGDRHNIASPGIYPEVWLEVLVRERVSDLFRTLPGLAGHWQQIQSEVNSTRKTAFFFDGGKTTDLGRRIYKAVGASIVNAADDAKFDFPEQVMVFNADIGQLRLSRSGGYLNLKSRP